MENKRPAGLVAIVIYKAFVAFLLGITAIILLLSFQNLENLLAFSESYVIGGKLAIIEWLIDKLTSLPPKTLAFSGAVAAVYSIVTAIEAIGLWYEKTWARLLVLGLVGVSISPEIFELIQGLTFLKLVVFMANIAAF
ncbi:DUF2127 domain-containing protein [Ancylothrix sp. C2]|uniref:DUF2127 domain-containing protein n=1 Tax=Ancylothrix sp. D3o TaxID=2953691 RepID=UPI0021BBB550|nr:DUF2127 domain-containing protein [Ancylothrix sp. D3o]MCT7950193.1 DUF2127 domain-containing protein [Ancylothrix sp. D3o]